MRQRYTLKKTEKLKSRKRIELLFREGKGFSLFPFRVIYLLNDPGSAPAKETSAPATPAVGTPAPTIPVTPAPAAIQAGFGVSSRLFRKAVDRNRIKRLCREAWRLQQHPLSAVLHGKGLSMAVFLIYTGKQLPDYPVVTQKIGVILQKLVKEIA
ncbi:MAG TPA: ribonuclease P protein component [Puia sp.]|nr:ribonuclease P protein component [Puia sp.]